MREQTIAHESDITIGDSKLATFPLVIQKVDSMTSRRTNPVVGDGLSSLKGVAV
jgi:hypothetical protein